MKQLERSMESWRSLEKLNVMGPRVQRDRSGRKGKEESQVTVGGVLVAIIRAERQDDAVRGTGVCSNRRSSY